MDDDLIDELTRGGMEEEVESEAQAFRRDDTGTRLQAPIRRVAPQRQPGPRPQISVRRNAQPPVRRVQPQYVEPPQYEEPVYEEQQFDAGSLPMNEPRTEAEARLHRARYFEMLLANPIFPQANSQGEYVEQCLREWAENELAMLLGMRPPADLAPFSKSQIVALRSLANKLLGNAARPDQDAAPTPPKATQPAPPKSPQKQPVQRRPMMRPRPQEPVVEEQSPPPSPARKPRRPAGQALIPARKPAAKPSPAAKEGTRPRLQASRGPVPPPPAQGSPVPEVDESTLVDGEIIERGSKRYKVTFATIDGEEKVVYQDVTPAATVEGAPPLPMPEGLALETTTMTQAANQVEKAMRGSKLLQRGVNAAMNA